MEPEVMVPEGVEQTPPSLPQPETAPLAAVPEDVTLRLATDFIALTAEFPHLVCPADLPDGVLDTAAEEGIPLLDAYLRYRWQEEKRVAAANATRRRAAAHSAGSLSRGAVETPPEQDAFLRAFRSAL